MSSWQGHREFPFRSCKIPPRQRKNCRKFPFGKIPHSAYSSTKFSDSYWRNYNDRPFCLTLHATLIVLVFKSLEIRIPTDWDWPAAIDHLPRPRLMQNYNRLVRLRKCVYWIRRICYSTTNWMRNGRVSTRNRQVESACYQIARRWSSHYLSVRAKYRNVALHVVSWPLRSAIGILFSDVSISILEGPRIQKR